MDKEKDFEGFKREFARLRWAYGRNEKQGQAAEYFKGLEEFTLNTVEKAFEYIKKESDKWPPLAHVVAVCRNIKGNYSRGREEANSRPMGPRERRIGQEFFRMLKDAIDRGNVEEFKREVIPRLYQMAEGAERQDREEADGKRRAA